MQLTNKKLLQSHDDGNLCTSKLEGSDDLVEGELTSSIVAVKLAIVPVNPLAVIFEVGNSGKRFLRTM